jgi:hypothetical protein
MHADLLTRPATARRRRPHARGALPVMAVLVLASVACESAGVQRAYMALDSTGARKRSAFFTDSQAIWCDVDYSSGRMDLSIDVTIRSTRLWSEALRGLEPIDEVIANGEVAGQEGIGTTQGFEWVPLDSTGKPAASGTVPYPVGDFVCEVMLDGKLMSSLPFSVSFPACPVPPVLDGLPCVGWVADGSVCPDPVGLPCACTAGVWTC